MTTRLPWALLMAAVCLDPAAARPSQVSADVEPPDVERVVSIEWLSRHLHDPRIRIITTGAPEVYEQGHIPGAAFVAHDATIGPDHRMIEPDALASTLAQAGASDSARIVLYGEHAMSTGWLYMAFASLGHADHVSMLDGNLAAWRAAGHRVATEVPPAGRERLTPRPVSDVVVSAAWVRDRLTSAGVRLLDVRTERERANGYLPGSTLVLWQDLYSDLEHLKLKSKDEIRELLRRAGVGQDQQAVTYCAIGMRASLMYFAARYAGVPARVYVGSWEDWRRQPGYPIAH
jgi:thiosulfate/3-mercaptopyruvate sulfurtransferase